MNGLDILDKQGTLDDESFKRRLQLQEDFGMWQIQRVIVTPKV